MISKKTLVTSLSLVAILASLTHAATYFNLIPNPAIYLAAVTSGACSTPEQIADLEAKKKTLDAEKTSLAASLISETKRKTALQTELRTSTTALTTLKAKTPLITAKEKVDTLVAEEASLKEKTTKTAAEAARLKVLPAQITAAKNALKIAETTATNALKAAETKVTTLQIQYDTIAKKAVKTAADTARMKALETQITAAKTALETLKTAEASYSEKSSLSSSRKAEIEAEIKAIDANLVDIKAKQTANSVALTALPGQIAKAKANQCKEIVCLTPADISNLTLYNSRIKFHPQKIKTLNEQLATAKKNISATDAKVKALSATVKLATPDAIAKAKKAYEDASKAYNDFLTKPRTSTFVATRDQLSKAKSDANDKYIELYSAASKYSYALQDQKRYKEAVANTPGEIKQLESELKTAQTEHPKLVKKSSDAGARACVSAMPEKSLTTENAAGYTGTSPTGNIKAGQSQISQTCPPDGKPMIQCPDGYLTCSPDECINHPAGWQQDTECFLHEIDQLKKYADEVRRLSGLIASYQESLNDLNEAMNDADCANSSADNIAICPLLSGAANNAEAEIQALDAKLDALKEAQKKITDACARISF